jgi:hypothetical protein
MVFILTPKLFSDYHQDYYYAKESNDLNNKAHGGLTSRKLIKL